jgi:hypothetical protein
MRWAERPKVTAWLPVETAALPVLNYLFFMDYMESRRERLSYFKISAHLQRPKKW